MNTFAAVSPSFHILAFSVGEHCARFAHLNFQPVSDAASVEGKAKTVKNVGTYVIERQHHGSEFRVKFSPSVAHETFPSPPIAENGRSARTKPPPCAAPRVRQNSLAIARMVPFGHIVQLRSRWECPLWGRRYSYRGRPVPPTADRTTFPPPACSAVFQAKNTQRRRSSNRPDQTSLSCATSLQRRLSTSRKPLSSHCYRPQHREAVRFAPNRPSHLSYCASSPRQRQSDNRHSSLLTGWQSVQCLRRRYTSSDTFGRP